MFNLRYSVGIFGMVDYFQAVRMLSVFSFFMEFFPKYQSLYLWAIGTGGERRSERSVLAARHDDDDDDVFHLQIVPSGFFLTVRIIE